MGVVTEKVEKVTEKVEKVVDVVMIKRMLSLAIIHYLDSSKVPFVIQSHQPRPNTMRIMHVVQTTRGYVTQFGSPHRHYHYHHYSLSSNHLKPLDLYLVNYYWSDSQKNGIVLWIVVFLGWLIFDQFVPSCVGTGLTVIDL